ncbi:MAG: hydroxyacid dehydrogenase, partial [Caldilinea sp.]
MQQFTVVLADPKGAADFEWIAPLAPGLRLLAPADSDPQALAALLADADALVTQNRAVDAATIAAAPRLKLIQRYGSRPDGIDL